MIIKFICPALDSDWIVTNGAGWFDSTSQLANTPNANTNTNRFISLIVSHVHTGQPFELARDY
jgi:hypothetical protein